MGPGQWWRAIFRGSLGWAPGRPRPSCRGWGWHSPSGHCEDTQSQWLLHLSQAQQEVLEETCTPVHRQPGHNEDCWRQALSCSELGTWWCFNAVAGTKDPQCAKMESSPGWGSPSGFRAGRGQWQAEGGAPGKQKSRLCPFADLGADSSPHLPHVLLSPTNPGPSDPMGTKWGLQHPVPSLKVSQENRGTKLMTTLCLVWPPSSAPETPGLMGGVGWGSGHVDLSLSESPNLFESVFSSENGQEDEMVWLS